MARSPRRGILRSWRGRSSTTCLNTNISFHIPSIRYGRRVTQNFNKLIGRYPGADGFKTGFICAAGYNLVASATRNGRRLIAVVLGASSGQARAVKAVQMLERGFSNDTLSWLKPSLGTVDNLRTDRWPRRRTCVTRCAAANGTRTGE